MTQALPPLGFVILRHVNSKITDLYWKESYAAIRRLYPVEPIMIVDDSSDKKWLREDVVLTNCTVLYDVEHRGCAELLPYYYAHRLRPAQRVVILHDGVFLHRPLELSWTEEIGIQFLWRIPHYYDDTIQTEIHELIDALPEGEREHVRSMYYHTKANWTGMFGVMSVIDITWLDEVEKRFSLFTRWFPVLKNREYRCALERVFGLVAYYHLRSRVKAPMFGLIGESLKWGITFMEYLQEYEGYREAQPIMKVWSGR